MGLLNEKFREVLSSTIPTLVIVFLIHFFVIDLSTEALIAFVIGLLLVIIGLTIFLTGVDLAINPIGELMGKGIARSNKLWILVIAGLVMGFFISVAEPSLTVLGAQIGIVSGGVVSATTIVTVVSIGLAILLVIGLIRIVYNWKIVPLLSILYGTIFILSLFTATEFVSIAFDASGATTGAITVPFMLALSVGVASMKKNSKSSEADSFGMVALASSGAILGVMVYNILFPTGDLTGTLEISIGSGDSFIVSFLNNLTTQLLEVAITVFPILAMFFFYQNILMKKSFKNNRRIWIGMIYVYVGLVLFLTGVNAGFMDIGSLIGYSIAAEGRYVILTIVGVTLGIVTIIAEPAVSVLTHQIEDVTSGSIKRGPVLLSLCIGVGAAVGLSIIRIVIPGLQLWHILLPGYIIALGLSYIVPTIFVGMAFDAGGVATGPLTATFILAFVQGATEAVSHAEIMLEGFGMIALVAMMPIVTLQLLGLVYELQKKKAEAAGQTD